MSPNWDCFAYLVIRQLVTGFMTLGKIEKTRDKPRDKGGGGGGGRGRHKGREE